MNVWQGSLVGALVLNALLGLSYRVYRYGKGGPRSDVVGQAVLALVLAAIAAGAAAGAGWARWAALVYALLFGLVVMPVWVLGVLIPLRPGPIDKAFTACYWGALALIAVCALAL